MRPETRREDVVKLHTRLLETQDTTVPATLEKRIEGMSHDDAEAITSAAFMVKALLERRELHSAAAVLGSIQKALKAHRSLYPLQLSYAEALLEFDHDAPAGRVLHALAPGLAATCSAKSQEELAFAAAILWRAALSELFLGYLRDARRHLEQADGIATDLADPTMRGVVATAQGWYEMRRGRWLAARRAFLSGLLLISYDGHPRRLWSDLALGLAIIELTAPRRLRMDVFDLQVLLDACANAVGKLRPYPMYVDGGGALDAMALADRAFTKGYHYQLHKRQIPASIRKALDERVTRHAV